MDKTKFKPEEQPDIYPGNPVWQTVEAWANMNLSRLRASRETKGADIRELDWALGGIESMEALLGLPAIIRKERTRDPIEDDNFDIPPLIGVE